MVDLASRVFDVRVLAVTSANVILKSTTEFPHIVPEARQSSPLARGERFGENCGEFCCFFQVYVEGLIGRRGFRRFLLRQGYVGQARIVEREPEFDT